MEKALATALIVLVAAAGVAAYLANEILISPQPTVKTMPPLSISNMTLREKIAQLVITAGTGKNVDQLAAYGVGGIYVLAQPTRGPFINIINTHQAAAKIPLFVTTDAEGCPPFNQLAYVKILKPQRFVASAEDAADVGETTATAMRDLGFNVVLGPTLDLAPRNGKADLWGCRAFSGDAEDVAQKGAAYIKGVQETGLAATAKHYPRQALTAGDTHTKIVTANITDEDLRPFRESINSGVKIIMLSHIITSGAINSSDKPASLSFEVVRELRKNLNFSGLIMTDDLSMLGVRNHHTNKSDVFVDAVAAGNDILLNIKAEELPAMIDSIERAISEGKITEAQIDSSVERVLALKREIFK